MFPKIKFIKKVQEFVKRLRRHPIDVEEGYYEKVDELERLKEEAEEKSTENVDIAIDNLK